MRLTFGPFIAVWSRWFFYFILSFDLKKGNGLNLDIALIERLQRMEGPTTARLGREKANEKKNKGNKLTRTYKKGGEFRIHLPHRAEQSNRLIDGGENEMGVVTPIRHQIAALDFVSNHPMHSLWSCFFVGGLRKWEKKAPLLLLRPQIKYRYRSNAARRFIISFYYFFCRRLCGVWAQKFWWNP